MKENIYVRNLKNGDKLPHQLALLEGDITSASTNTGKGQLLVSIECQTLPCSEHVTKDSVWPIRNGRFKAIVPLHNGQNRICLKFERCISMVTLFYEPPQTNGHFIRPLYLICKDDEYDGHFQGPEGPDQCTAQVAFQKIDLGIKLLQLFVAESLHRHGLTRRTFALDTRSGQPLCQFFCLNRVTTREASKLSESDLWRLVKDELTEDHALTDKERSKFIAFISFTRYANPTGVIPRTHGEILALTSAHGALGGGGLALLGTGCLHTWAAKLSEFVSRFTDCTEIDRARLMDDSRYRKTYWACYAATLGAACHELGHIFGLNHSVGGLMHFGFAEIHRSFILPELLNESETSDAEEGDGFSDEEPTPGLLNPSDLVVNGASASSLIDRIKLKRCLGNDWEAADFHRAEAVWLRYHKWLNALHPNNSGHGPTVSRFQIRARHGLRVVILAKCRADDENDVITSYYHEFTNGCGQLTFQMNRMDLMQLATDNALVRLQAEDSYGNTLIAFTSRVKMLNEEWTY